MQNTEASSIFVRKQHYTMNYTMHQIQIKQFFFGTEKRKSQMLPSPQTTQECVEIGLL